MVYLNKGLTCYTLWTYGHALSHMVAAVEFLEFLVVFPGYFLDKVSTRGPTEPFVSVHSDSW
jgi:hypothetical protein